MENVQLFSTDYRSLIEEKVRTHFRSILIGSFALSLLSSLVYFYFVPTSGFMTDSFDLLHNKEISQSESVQNLTKKVQDSNMNISQKNNDTADSLSIAADTNGQISAISTQQVTVKGDKYTVQPGDSISSIALQAYGDLNAWPRIAEANKLLNPEAIEVGMVLIIPR